MATLAEARTALEAAYAAYYAGPVKSKDDSAEKSETLRLAQEVVDRLETAEKREEYAISAGSDRSWIGASLGHADAVIFDVLDGSQEQATATLTHDEAEAFYAKLGKLLGH